MDPKWNEDLPIYRQLRDRVVAMILEGVLLFPVLVLLLGRVVMGTIDKDRGTLVAVEKVGPDPACIDQALGVARELEFHAVDHLHPAALEAGLAEVEQPRELVVAGDRCRRGPHRRSHPPLQDVSQKLPVQQSMVALVVVGQ